MIIIRVGYFFQAVFKQFGGGGGYGGSDNVVTDEAELMLHQKLERLYISTRAAKVAFHPPVGDACFCVLKNSGFIKPKLLGNIYLVHG